MQRTAGITHSGVVTGLQCSQEVAGWATLAAKDVRCRAAAELVVSRGYPLERHAVVTPDGYELVMFRIPHGAQRCVSIATESDHLCHTVPGPHT